jgi:NTE family protein
VSISINQLRRRAARGTRTAFVLAGGGNQAVSEVGMLRALLERGITPDVIVGTSAGAWNGSVLAANPTVGGVESLVEMWESIRGEDVFPGGKLSRAWNLLTRDDHLFSDQGLRTLLEKAATPDTFEELVVPLRVVACDLDSGEEVVFARGPLVPALLASAALPGLFPPVRHAGRTLVDGAVVNTVPLWHALSGPVDRIYVLTVTGELMRRPLRSPIDVAIRAFTISRKQRFELELRMVPPGIEVHVLPAPVDDREFFDFSDPLMLIEEAHHMAERYLDEAELEREQRSTMRRSWWRRYVS